MPELGGGQGSHCPPPVFDRSVNPIPYSNRGGQIILTYYYWHLQSFSLYGIINTYRWNLHCRFDTYYRSTERQIDGENFVKFCGLLKKLYSCDDQAHIEVKFTQLSNVKYDWDIFSKFKSKNIWTLMIECKWIIHTVSEWFFTLLLVL